MYIYIYIYNSLCSLRQSETTCKDNVELFLDSELQNITVDCALSFFCFCFLYVLHLVSPPDLDLDLVTLFMLCAVSSHHDYTMKVNKVQGPEVSAIV